MSEDNLLLVNSLLASVPDQDKVVELTDTFLKEESSNFTLKKSESDQSLGGFILCKIVYLH